MRRVLTSSILAFLLLAVIGCNRSNDSEDSVGTKDTYSLCPKTDDSRQGLYEIAKIFANTQKAKFIDRSAGAKQELSDIGSAVLKNTGGTPILLTIEKPGEFRISVTNLGLTNKIALTIRSWGADSEASAVSGFMKNLSLFWTIQEIEGGVTDDPPCSPL